MAVVRLKNRVQCTVSGTPGTGSITLGSASSAYQTFVASGLVDGDSVPYLAVDGTAWEVGTGTLSSTSTVLARTLEASSTGSLLSLSSAAIISLDMTAATLAALSSFGALPGGGFTPDGRAQLEENFDVLYGASTQTGSSVVTAGTVYLFGLYARSRRSIGNIYCRITAAPTLTAGQNFIGIYQGGARLGTCALDSIWNTTGYKTMPISGSPAVVAPGNFYVGFVVNGTTGTLRFRGQSSTAELNDGLSVAGTYRSATANTSQTSLPSSLSGETANNSGTQGVPWFGVGT